MLKANSHHTMRLSPCTEAPGTASAVDMAMNKHILNSLNNNDQTMGQMAGLTARVCEDREPSGWKRLKRAADQHPVGSVPKRTD